MTDPATSSDGRPPLARPKPPEKTESDQRDPPPADKPPTEPSPAPAQSAAKPPDPSALEPKEGTLSL